MPDSHAWQPQRALVNSKCWLGLCRFASLEAVSFFRTSQRIHGAALSEPVRHAYNTNALADLWIQCLDPKIKPDLCGGLEIAASSKRNLNTRQSEHSRE